MRRFIHICLWTLTGIFATASLSAQNPFTYIKEKHTKMLQLTGWKKIST